MEVAGSQNSCRNMVRTCEVFWLWKIQGHRPGIHTISIPTPSLTYNCQNYQNPWVVNECLGWKWHMRASHRGIVSVLFCLDL
jgi:hypothetical protein